MVSTGEGSQEFHRPRNGWPGVLGICYIYTGFMECLTLLSPVELFVLEQGLFKNNFTT